MAYDDYIAERISRSLERMHVNFLEKRMMGGLVFMVDDKMFCGIHYSKKNETDLLMARVGPEASVSLVGKKGCQPMDFTGRPMKGFVFVTPEGYDRDEDLDMWLNLCLEYNSYAESSKKKN